MALFDIPWLSESIKKRALRYLLQRYLGNFLLEKLTLDQLSLDLYNGKGAVKDIRLDVDTINEELNQLLPFKFINGSINELSVFVPWSSLLTDSCSLNFDGISFNVCKLLNKKNNDFRESIIITKSLMTSSMQIAEEIVNEEQEKFDGLEMFAQLIDSVLRRFILSASNTSFKFVAPRKSGDGQEIEIRIKYLKCEEEEQVGSNDKNNENLNIVSETITKIITLEGIEILINEVLVCKLNGRHSIKLKIDENKSDLQIYLGSHIFAIMTSKHLETLIEFFEYGDQIQLEIPMSGEKLMNSEDYMRIEQQLQLDAGYAKSANNTVISSSSVTIDSNKWTTCGLIEDEPKFLPLQKILEDKETTNTTESIAKKSQFSCHIKIPGLMLCIISSDHQSMPAFDGMPIVDSSISFSKVNECLDQILEGYNHMRFLTLRLLFDINSDSFSLSCGDLMLNEVLDNKMSTILWNELSNQPIVSPLLRFKIKDKSMLLNLCSMRVRLDPTFLERYHKYLNFNSRKNNSQTNLDFNIEVNCDEIRLELLFPIPDLRPGERSASELRDESLLLKLMKTSFNYSSVGGEIKCQNLGVDFKMLDTYSNILNAHSVDSELIRMKFRIGINGTINTTLDETEANTLFDAEMEDSIYVGQVVPQMVIEPFQVKRKVIGRGGDENEQVITPGDRQHLNKYIESSASSAQLHFELFVPTIDIHFQNKDQFELLYNRIGNDLILWTPLSDNLMHNNIVKESISQNPTFFSCKTAAMTDSFGSTNSSFHSIAGSTHNSRINLLTFIINVNDVNFEMGSKEEHIQSIFCQNLMLGIVVGDENDNSSTICLCGENLSLKSDGSLIVSGNVYSEPNCTLNLAVDIKRESDSLKKIKLALQLSCAAMYEIQIDVFEQFWNFINVVDEEVIGYIPPKVITELHIDLVNSAIALENLANRPALITFEDIYLTSMVVENTNQTLLRIFAEETLFCFKRNKTALETMKNYICVVQSGIIDLNLKLGKDGKLEFKLSNNQIDIRVCSDSLSALCQLINSLTANSSHVEIECNSTENVSFQDSLDGNLIEDALGENERTYESGDSDEEPPKFCSCESPKLDESGFWILGDDDLGAGIKMTAEPQIRVLTTEPVKVVENHFNISRFRIIPEITPSTISRYLLEEMTLILHLFDGKDFDDDISSNENIVDKRAEDTKSYKSGKSLSLSEPRVRFSEGSVHIWENIDLISAPTSLRGSNSGQNIGVSSAFKSTGGSKRQYDTCVQLCLGKVKTLFENFDTDFPLSWRFLFLVQDIEIIDRVRDSRIKKMLYEYCSESMPRRKHANMISIRATTFRNPSENSEESDLKISVKPLRVNIDQDTLLFLGEFFSTVIATLSSDQPENPISTIANNPINNNLQNYDETMRFEDTISSDTEATQATTTSNSSSSTVKNIANFSSSNSTKVFFKCFSFSPDVPIRLDYHGKHVDFDRGALRGLFLGLAQLNQSELRLKRLNNKHGILGIDKVLSYAVAEWTKDIKRNQLPSLLGGVGPMHSFIQLFQGIKDLIWMPIDQYRRDRRLVRGLQRGASSFSASTAMATLDLANRFVTLIQSAAQFAHDVVTPPTPGHRQQTILGMNAQPRDLREGMAAAYAVMREGLHDTVRGVANAGLAADDVSGAIGEVVRQIPSTLVRPLIHASQATSNVLVGMRNQLTPEARKDDHEKWKNATDR